MRKRLLVVLSAILMIAFCGAFSGCSKDEDITVTFETNGSQVGIPEQNIKKGDVALRPLIEPVKAGYGFYDWYIDSALTKPFVFHQTILNADTVIYARYIKDVTVSFELEPDVYEGETPDYQTIVVKYGDDYSVPVPVNNGDPEAVFAGWYSQPDGKGVRYTNSSSDGIAWPTVDCIFYASWVLPTEGLIYTANGGQSYSLESVTGVTGPTEGEAFSIVVAAVYEGKPVTGIMDGAFEYSAVTSVILPDSILTVGERAFSNCIGLTDAVFPSGVTSIGANAFDGASKLLFAPIPKEILSIGDEAFKYCALTEVRFPSRNDINIGDGVFSGCSKLWKVNLPNTMTVVPDMMFRNCKSLISIGIPSMVLTIGEDAFRGCDALKKIELTSQFTEFTGVRVIMSGAFWDCKALQSFDLSGIEEIENRAFQASGLKEITIPVSVTALGSRVFAVCDDLKTIYVELHSQKPLGWDSAWNSDCDAAVVWRQ